MARKILFGDYDTAAWGLTLTGWELSAPQYKASFVSVPGRDGDLDLSTALTDGEPRYSNRDLTAAFECSNGTHATRAALFGQIVNAIDGRRMQIILPDDDAHAVDGRLQVAVEYNDLAHGALTITANCGPWREAIQSKSVTLTAVSTEKTATLTNNGRRILTPTVVVSGTDVSVSLKFGESSWALSAGTYKLPGLLLRPGSNTVKYSGSGTVVLTWTEAVL